MTNDIIRLRDAIVGDRSEPKTMTEKCIDHRWMYAEANHKGPKLCVLCQLVEFPPKRIGIFLRIKLWYNGVCTKHLVYKHGTEAGMFCVECQQVKNARHALRKQALDNLIVELRRG